MIIMLLMNWSSLVLMTLQEDLAQAEGINVLFCNLLLMFLMTLVVAVSIRSVGILLISSLLIIPAATARQLASISRRNGVIIVIFRRDICCFGNIFFVCVWILHQVPLSSSAASLFTLLTIYLQVIRKK